MKKYNNNIWLMVCFLFVGQIVNAQINIGGQPKSFDENHIKQHKKNSTGKLNENAPIIDFRKVKKEDEEQAKNGMIRRLGYPNKVNYNLNNSGEWTELDNGDRIWKLTIISKMATFIYLTYDQFNLPEGATLYLYDTLKTAILGGFTSRNNKGTIQKPGKYATGIINADAVTLEYFEPNYVKNQGIISVSKVIHGYQSDSLILTDGNFGTTTCTVNVNCSPEGDNWQNQKKSVVKIMRGGFPCSGFLVNNTKNDGKLYLMTANHCLTGDALTNPDQSDWLFYWNYESVNCANGSDFNPPVTVGSTILSNDSLSLTSDFALLLLQENPYNLNVNPYYSGWDRQTPSGPGVGIHHPAGDIKKISTYSTNPYGSYYHWSVGWITTQNGPSIAFPGTSGSPLYNNFKRAIGQCHYVNGFNCGSQVTSYGQFHISWDLKTSTKRQLKYWLDPLNTNPLYLDGSYCTTNTITNKTYSSNTTETGCSISATNVMIPNGKNVVYDAVNSTTLNGSFQVDLGASLEIK
jgi:lysyl endopeptidase